MNGRRRSRPRNERFASSNFGEQDNIPIAAVTAIAVDQYFKASSMSSEKVVETSSSSQIPRVRGWPKALRQAVLSTFTKKPNIEKAREFLEKNSWPSGLIEAFCANITKIPIRFFLVDDSGSMNAPDGFKIIGGDRDAKIIACTRYSYIMIHHYFLQFC